MQQKTDKREKWNKTRQSIHEQQFVYRMKKERKKENKNGRTKIDVVINNGNYADKQTENRQKNDSTLNEEEEYTEE